MARVGDLDAYCFKHGLKMITIADLIAYRRRNDKLVERVVATALPTGFGDFKVVGYRSLVDDKHHVALVKGDVAGEDDVLVRVHSECLTGDVFHSLRCDCGEQLESALAMIEREGRGRPALPRPGGPRHRAAQQAARLQAPGGGPRHRRRQPRARPARRPARLRHRRADPRRPRAVARSGSSPTTRRRSAACEGYGLSVTEQVPIEHMPNPHNEAYLRAKAERMGHTLHHQGLALDEEMLQRTSRSASARQGERASPSSSARFYEDLADRLVASARRRVRGGGRREVDVFDVPGAFELPLAAQATRARPGATPASLPRRGHPRRDLPLRLRLRRVPPAASGRPAARPACRARSAC